MSLLSFFLLLHPNGLEVMWLVLVSLFFFASNFRACEGFLLRCLTREFRVCFGVLLRRRFLLYFGSYLLTSILEVWLSSPRRRKLYVDNIEQKGFGYLVHRS